MTIAKFGSLARIESSAFSPRTTAPGIILVRAEPKAPWIDNHDIRLNSFFDILFEFGNP